MSRSTRESDALRAAGDSKPGRATAVLPSNGAIEDDEKTWEDRS